MNNAEKFEQNLLKSSVSNNLDAAKREWSLYRIDWVDRAGVCICGKTHISKLVIIMNSVNGKFLEIGADCAYEHLGIEVREEQYRQLKEAKNLELLILVRNGITLCLGLEFPINV